MTRTAVPLPALLGVPLGRLHDLGAGSRLEWFEPDGKGGYAAGTAVNANTRRDHGVVVVQDETAAARQVLLARLDEVVVLDDGSRYDLGVAFYPEAVHPTGHVLLQSFALDPWPMWHYRLGDVELVKELFVSRRIDATVIRYRIRGCAATLELRPLVPIRIHGEPSRATDELRKDAEASERLVAYQPHDDASPLVLSFASGAWHAAPDWYYNTIHPLDAQLGRASPEDLFCPGVLVLPLDSASATTLACGRRPARISNAPQWVAEELRRRGRAADGGRLAAHDDVRLGELGARLGLAADAFLIERSAGRTIVSGYPGSGATRESPAALVSGLCLSAGRITDAAAVLRALAPRIMPTVSPPRAAGAAAIGTRGSAVDNASPPGHEPWSAPTTIGVEDRLWFVEAVGRLRDAGGDISGFAAIVDELLDSCVAGDVPGIRMRVDGLIESVEMPGREAVATVAANALWYNALIRGATLTVDAERAARWAELAERSGAAFDIFWFADGGYLYDRLDAGGRGLPGLRPGQLLAVSLPGSPLAAPRARKVVDAVDRELVVPLGVRSLSPVDPGYDPGAAGRGAALPWWLGHFASAYARVHGADRHTRERLRRIITEFDSHLSEHGLGYVSEYVAGDAPHLPAGDPACAHACASVLEVLHFITEPAPAPFVAAASGTG